MVPVAPPQSTPSESEADHGASPRPAAPGHDAAPSSAPRRPRVPLAARWGALALVAVVVAEATCRVEEWVRYGTPLLSRAASHDDLFVVDADGAHARPGTHFGKWRINGLGTRGPDAAAAKPRRTLRLITVGASETFGLYESAGREYPRQLEDTLRARRVCAAGWNVEVLNAALAGMSLPTITQDVRSRLQRLSPDVVVIYPTPVGYLDYSLPRPRAPRPGPVEPLPFTRALHLRIVDRISNQPKVVFPSVVATWLRRRMTEQARRALPVSDRFETVPPDRLAAFDADLRAVVGSVRAIGATPLLGTHANAFLRGAPDSVRLASWERFYPRASGTTLIAFEAAAREVTARVARDSGVTVADVARTLASEPSAVAFADFSHFTDHGAARAAAAVADAAAKVAGPRCGSAVSASTNRSHTEHNHHFVGGSAVTAR